MQATLFDQPTETGAQLRDRGILKAAEHADFIQFDWNKKAFECFKQFLLTRAFPWACEDFRKWCQDYTDLPVPPSLRAFGGIIKRAACLKIIHKTGYTQVKNPRAHMANASLWEEIK